MPKSLDRDGLKAAVASYMAAMTAHDPKAAPLAGDAVIVENLLRIEPSEGLWKRASATPSSFEIFVPDVQAQQVGYIAMLEADGKPAQIGLRLKLQDGLIAEAEQIAVYELTDFGLPNLKKPRAAYSQTVPETWRDSRGRLFQIAASYYDALVLNNGRLAPFADDCVRYENGMQTCRNSVPDGWTSANFGLFGAMGAAAQLDSQVMTYITAIDHRRVYAADEAYGLAAGFSHFRHPMEQSEYKVFGVPGVDTWKMEFQPFDLPAMHIYKIWGGQLHEIDALGFMAPYQSKAYFEG